MSGTSASFWLLFEDGARLRLTEQGILVGRGLDCDLLLPDPQASRHHATVRLSGGHAELTPMGRLPVRINGKEAQGPTRLGADDVVTFPGCEVRVAMAPGAPAEARTIWTVERRGGQRFGLGRGSLSVGGSAEDDLRIGDWPPGAVRFSVAQGALLVELGSEARVNEEDAPAGAALELQDGGVVEMLGERFKAALSGRDEEPATTALVVPALPRRVELRFLPRGGELTVEFPGATFRAFLPERRCDLVASLLKPPTPYRAGDFVPDAALLPIVWPDRKDTADRVALNVLLHRARRDLVACGVNGVRLLERSPAGGAIRFSLGPGADAVVI